MARRKYKLTEIAIDNEYVQTKDLFFSGEKLLIAWLNNSAEGKWWGQNLDLNNLDFRINYNIDSDQSIVHIVGEMSEEEYTFYMLIFGG